MAKHLIESMIDQLMESDYENFKIRLSQIVQIDQDLAKEVYHEVIDSIRSLKQYQLTSDMLKKLEQIFKLIDKVDSNYFKNRNIYKTIAIFKGYQNNQLISLVQKQQLKGYFVRNLKKQPSYWGLTLIQNLYSGLVSKSHSDYYLKPKRQINVYLYTFIKDNILIFPPAIQIYQIIFKHMLMLQPDKQQQSTIYQQLFKIFLSNPYHIQVINRNFRYALQFYRVNFNQKQYGVNPQLAILNLLKKYDIDHINKMLTIGSLGLSWNNGEIRNCISNIIKMGINQQNYRILKCFIELGKTNNKYEDLLEAYKLHLPKIFIFLKFPQLYSSSLKAIKQMILGPWPVTHLYNQFVSKCVEFCKNRQISDDFIIFIRAVITKYRQTTVTDDLSKILTQMPDRFEQKAHEQIKLYEWRIQRSKAKENINKNKQISSEELRGINNIGNSCYMNSFLQALFMTKQLRKIIINTSTLKQQQIILQKLRSQFKDENKSNINIPNMARSLVKPLAQIQRLFCLLLKSKRTSIDPKNVKNVVPVEFQNMFQHDSIQFGRSIIDLLNSSNIPNIFTGEAITQIQCPFCNRKRTMKEEFLDIMLASRTFEDQSNKEEIGAEKIQDLIHHSFQDQKIEGLICQQCNNQTSEMINQSSQNNLSIKKHWINRFPNYLILTLKRFEYNIKQNKNFKKHFKVEMQPEFTVNIEGGQKIQYMLYAVIVHRGSSANSGHYFTFSRQNFKIGQNQANWICLNDSSVSALENFTKLVEFLQVNNEDTPYIMFACRKSYWIQNWQAFQQPLILRQPLQLFIERDNNEYIKALGKAKSIGNIDFSGLKFTGSYLRRDQDDDDDPYRGNGIGFSNHNNPII